MSNNSYEGTASPGLELTATDDEDFFNTTTLNSSGFGEHTPLPGLTILPEPTILPNLTLLPEHIPSSEYLPTARPDTDITGIVADPGTNNASSYGVYASIPVFSCLVLVLFVVLLYHYVRRRRGQGLSLCGARERGAEGGENSGVAGTFSTENKDETNKKGGYDAYKMTDHLSHEEERPIASPRSGKAPRKADRQNVAGSV